MKKILRFLLFTILSFAGLILLYLGLAWLLSRITVQKEPDQAADITFYLKTNGVHTDIIIPVRTDSKDWNKDFPVTDTRSGDTTLAFIAFGWGDKAFYLETPTWADLKASTAFKAAFGLSVSAMHITYYPVLQENENCIRRTMGKAQHERLIRFIEESIDRDANGRPIVIPTEARYGQHDAFYEAKGRYSLFRTCNTWTNNALKASGQCACWWTPFDKGIFYQYRKELKQ